MNKPEPELVALMLRAHSDFADRLSMEIFRLEGLPPEAMRREIRALAEPICDEACAAAGLDADAEARTWMIGSVLDEAFGCGPLEPLLAEADCDAIVIRGPRDVWVEANGDRRETAAVFADDAHVQRTLEKQPVLKECLRQAPDKGDSALRLDVREVKRRLADRAPEAVTPERSRGAVAKPEKNGLWARFTRLLG